MIKTINKNSNNSKYPRIKQRQSVLKKYRNNSLMGWSIEEYHGILFLIIEKDSSALSWIGAKVKYPWLFVFLIVPDTPSIAPRGVDSVSWSPANLVSKLWSLAPHGEKRSRRSGSSGATRKVVICQWLPMWWLSRVTDTGYCAADRSPIWQLGPNITLQQYCAQCKFLHFWGTHGIRSYITNELF